MKEIPKIATNSILRKSKLLKLVIGAGSEIIQNHKRGIEEKIQAVIETQAEKITHELSIMKGPVMKMGQLLSLYTDGLVPEPLKKALENLENQSFYLNWNEISKTIPKEFFEKLEIEEKAFAAASLGQVHRAKNRQTGQDLVLKIQYQNVEAAIENDLSTLKLILKIAKIIPKEIPLDLIFQEVKSMLYQEIDYQQELVYMQNFSSLIGPNSPYIVPNIYPEFSTKSILCLEYQKGISPRHAKDLTQELRNQLGKSFLELLFHEIFDWGQMQTDANPGNFLIQQDKWILLDFGASKVLTPAIQLMYKKFITSVIHDKFSDFNELLYSQGHLNPLKTVNTEILKEYFTIISEPFRGENYHWGESSIPEKVLQLLPKMLKEFSIHRPPADSLFIDRKIGGVFYILKMLNAEFNSREVALRFIN